MTAHVLYVVDMDVPGPKLRFPTREMAEHEAINARKAGIQVDGVREVLVAS